MDLTVTPTDYQLIRCALRNEALAAGPHALRPDDTRVRAIDDLLDKLDAQHPEVY